MYNKQQNPHSRPQIENMNFLKPQNLEQAFTDIQSRFTSALSTLQTQAKQALESTFPPNIKLPSLPQAPNPTWARISTTPTLPSPSSSSSSSLSIQEIEERLAGVPVYALSNPSDEFVLVSSGTSGKSLGLFCFREEDVHTLLEQMKTMDPGMRQGSKVVPVALNKVVLL